MDVKTLLLVLLWAGVTVSTLVDLQKRIIGGRNCGPTERRYHVLLISEKSTGESSLCGGSLISDRWILTAAHCWEDEPGWTMTAYLKGHAVPVTITVHRIYSDPQNREHDIMLLQLPNPTQSPRIDLPDCRNPPNIGDTVEIAGFASTTMGPNNERREDRLATDLQCADTTVVGCQGLRNCLQRNSPEFYAESRYQSWQCFQRAGVDISTGDSGGGVVFNGRLYGVISFTGNPTHACVEAAGFMDICQYMNWIYTTTGIARPGPIPGPIPGPRTGPRSRPGARPGAGPRPGHGPRSRSRSRSRP